MTDLQKHRFYILDYISRLPYEDELEWRRCVQTYSYWNTDVEEIDGDTYTSILGRKILLGDPL